MQFFHHVAHQAAPAQQVAAQLFNELLEARLALGAGGLLVRLGDWCADREVVADEQRQRLDLDVLVALQALGLARQAIKALGDAASRWSAASGDNQDAKAAATMLDLDTPFLAASSSRRLACSGWMNRLRR
jgi:hypothetical protein